MNDVVLKNNKEHYVNVVIEPSNVHPPETTRPPFMPKQQASPKLGKARREAKKVVAKNTSDRVRSLRKKTK